ncbi:MAG: hypothetical protein M3O31_13745, partial [Acidobacteriota bacterium]|nr:hypothetical protein [Acidobacteriota bacterium]
MDDPQTSSGITAPSRALDLILLTSLALILAGLLDITWFRLYFAHPGNDQSWLLYAAGRMLHGTPLYGSQLNETNPPLIIWVSSIPMAAAGWLHIKALTSLRIFVTVLVVLSTLWCLRILRAADLARGLVLCSLWTLALLALEVSQHGNDFGQKEHFLILFLLPLLFFESVSPHVRLLLRERVALGIGAGLSICLKPQDSLILVCFELFFVLYTRNIRRLLRPEISAAVLTGLVYVLSVKLFASVYLSQIVPQLRDTYWAFGEQSTFEVLRGCPIFNVLAISTLLAWILLRRHLRYPAAPAALLAGAAGGALAYAIQNKGWPYQFFPQEALLACAIAWLAFDALVPLVQASPRLLLTRALLPFAVVIAMITVPTVYRIGYNHDRAVLMTPDSQFLDSTLAAYPRGTPVTILAINVMGFNDILNGELTLATRYHHLWMLPAIV